MDFAVAAAIRAVHPTVETPEQAVHAELLVAFGETGQDHAAFIGPAIAFGYESLSANTIEAS